MKHQTEWIVFCLVLLILSFPILAKWRLIGRWSWLLLSILAGAIVAGGLWSQRVDRAKRGKQELAKSTPREEKFAGYVSSDKCQACHPQQHESWHRSFHRTMTQPAIPAAIQANFENVSLELEGEMYRLERKGEEFWADMVDPDWVHDRAKADSDFIKGISKVAPDRNAKPHRARKRLSLVTGSHHFQAFWVASSHYPNVQFSFPFAWLLDEKRWVPRKDTFIRDANEPLIQIWNMNCIQCHTTAGQPQKDASGNFASRVAEFGIACESCHGPAEEHVRLNADPLRRYHLHGKDRHDTSIVNPSRLDSKLSSHVCGQCHGIKWMTDREQWLRHGSSFRPGQDLEQLSTFIQPRRFETDTRLPDFLKQDREFLNLLYWPDGTVRVAGREFNAIAETACYQRGKLSCLSCHSMHQSRPDDQLAADMNTSRACIQCHDSYRTKIREHTHHAPESSGSQCYNCHMPHTTYGLLKAIRSHTIESPNVRTALDSGRLNACNLCHLDQSLGWTAQHLSDWYGHKPAELDQDQQSISAAALMALRGDAAQRALIAWNIGWEPARKTSGDSWLPPFLLQLLDDPYSAVRCIAYRSLRTFPGFEQLQYDFVGPTGQRQAAQQKGWAIWNRDYKARSGGRGMRMLLKPDGELQQETIDRLLGERDNRRVELAE
jgi:predicted CXXCH cytochrome family protein